jgi:hypothetical protein
MQWNDEPLTHDIIYQKIYHDDFTIEFLHLIHLQNYFSLVQTRASTFYFNIFSLLSGFADLFFCRSELEPGTHYTIVPYAKAEEVEGDFQVIVFSDKKTVESKELKPWKHEAGVFGEWIGKNCWWISRW